MSYLSDAQLDRLEERVGDLIAARENVARDFSEYRDDPVRFMREVLQFDPWSKQEEVCRSVRDNKRTVVRGHHGAGKDAILGALLLWAAYARDMLCVVISATEKQLLGQVWTELTRFWTRAEVFGGRLLVGELRIDGEKRIVAMTSRSTSHMTGWHNHRGTGVFVAISESQAEQVGNAAFDAAEGNTAEDGSRIIVVGNPVHSEGRFFEVSKKPTWCAIRISAFDHPNVAQGRVVVPGGPAPTWPQEMAAEYGTDSAFYVSRVLGEFPTEGSVDALFRAEWLEEAYQRHERGIELLPGRPTAAALDVARSYNRDESVCAIAQGPAVLKFEAWHSRDLVETTARFLHAVDRVRLGMLGYYCRGLMISPALAEDRDQLAQFLTTVPAPSIRLVIDAAGVGGGAVDEARRRKREVREYWGWNPATNDKVAANVRAEVYWGIRRGLEKGTVALPRDPKLHEEAIAMEYTLDSKGRVLMISKDDLRKKLDRSPDRLDGSAMALSETLGLGTLPPPVIQTVRM